MSQSLVGLDLLVDVALSYVEGYANTANEESKAKLSQAFSDFLHQRKNYADCQSVLIEVAGRDDALVKLNEILNVPDEPFPPTYGSNNPAGASKDDPMRKKTRTWTSAEDQRLLAGLAKYGPDNWQMIAKFIGGGRNRAQCSQRWSRCLNPKISKKSWTSDDDKKLKEMVELYGEKNWTKIASLFGNRSDVQCRYHYRQLMSRNNPSRPPPIQTSFNLPTPEIHQTKLSLIENLANSKLNLQEIEKKSKLIEENVLTENNNSGISSPETTPVKAPNEIVLSPGLTKIKDLIPLLEPFDPITPRLRHAREQAIALMETHTLNMRTTKSLPVWGVCGNTQESLKGFLRQFH